MSALDRRVVAAPGEPVSITHAQLSHSEDMSRREKRYFLTMFIRVACFIALCFAPGWWKLAFLVGAAVLPTVAVVLGNAADRRSAVIDDTEPAFHVAGEITDHQTITGEVVDD